MMGDGADEALEIALSLSGDDEDYENESEVPVNRWSKRKTTYTEFEDVEVLRDSPRAILCRFPGGRERWVPISQTPSGFEWKIGEKQTIEISDWLTSQPDWDAPPEEEEDARFPDAVCLKESAKAIEVRVGSGEPVWIPKTHVRKTSEVQGDGDRGVLVISEWIASQKFGAGGAPAGPSVADDVRGQRRGGGGGGGGGGQADIPFVDNFFPPDDDVPFIRYWP
jgi:hypothetical protein